MKEELGVIYFRNYDMEGFYYPKSRYNYYELEWQLITINLN